MRRAIVLLSVWLSVAAAIGGFFLPWVRIELREPALVQQLKRSSAMNGLLGQLNDKLGRVVVKVRRGTETITADLSTLSDLPRHISGAQIPQLANDERAKLVMVLAELATHQPQDLRLKSYAVYLVPGMALVFGVLLTGWGRVRPLAVGVALGCLGIAGTGFWKLLAVKSDAITASIIIGPGLWTSVWAYVGLAFAAGCSIWCNEAGKAQPVTQRD